MPVNFGGSSNDSLFASLYREDVSKKKAAQNAADSNAQDQWANGQMDDAAWLAYIANRLASTGNDAAEHEQWVEAQRKYTVLISDNVAQHAYQNGGSINDLIAYYQTRLASLSKNSNDYRDIQSQVNDLMDKRLSDQTQSGAQAILDKITSGKGTYAQLQSYLAQAISLSVPNGSLRKSLEGQLQNVKDQIHTNKVEGTIQKLQYEYDSGKLSAGGYASAIRHQAAQFQQSDPKRYYQMLDAASQIAKTGGSGGGGGGGGSGNSATRKAALQKIDSIMAQKDNLQSLAQQFEANNGRIGSTGVDPTTGKAVVFTQDYVTKLDQNLVHVFDKLSAAYLVKVDAKGNPAPDKSAAANVQKQKSYYISTHVVAHNTMAADDSTRHLLTATDKIVTNALNDPDPMHALAQLADIGHQWDTYAKGLTTNQQGAATTPAGNILNTAADSAKTPMQSVDTDLSHRAGALANAILTLTTPGGVDDATAQQVQADLAVLDGTSGQFGGGLSQGVLKALGDKVGSIAARQAAITTGDAVRVIQDGKVTFVPTVPVSTQTYINGQATSVTTKQPVGISLGKGQQMVDVFMDINGSPTKVQAIADLTPVNGLNQWTASSNVTIGTVKLVAGSVITSDQLALLNNATNTDAFQQAVNSGKLKQSPAFAAYQVSIPAYTDTNGQQHQSTVWVQDPDTQQWYKDALPIRGATFNPDGTVKVDANGQPDIQWAAYAAAAGVPAPYAGDNVKAMQNVVNQGGVDVSAIGGRDALGTPSKDHSPDMKEAYYTPDAQFADRANTDHSQSASWWDPNTQYAKAQRQVDIDRTQKQQDIKDQGNTTLTGTSMTGGKGIDDITQGLKAAGSALGVNLDGTKPRTYTGSSMTGGKGADDVSLGLPGAIKTGASASGVALNIPNGSQGTFSGPRVGAGTSGVALALPKSKGPAIITPKPTKHVVLDTPTPKGKPAVTPKVKPTLDTARGISGGTSFDDREAL